MRALVYGATVFFSFFLMLVFMTYNVSSRLALRPHILNSRLQAYLIASVVIGATVGNYIFSSTMNTDSVHGPNTGSGLACH